MLCHIKDCHHNVEGIADERDSYKGLENPLEENSHLKVCKVIVVNDHLNQFATGNEGENQTCNREYDGLGNIPYQGKDPRRKVRRGSPHLRCNIANLRVYRIKESRQLDHDAVDKNPLHPCANLVEYVFQKLRSFLQYFDCVVEKNRTLEWLICHGECCFYVVPYTFL